MWLKIEFNYGLHFVEVADNATVSDLKNKMSDLVPVADQRLEFNELVLENGKTLQSYKIGKDATVLLRHMYVINVQEFGQPNKKCGLVVHKDNTVGDLEQMLEKYGFDLATVRLTKTDMEIPELSHSTTLEDYNINHGTTLYVHHH